MTDFRSAGNAARKMNNRIRITVLAIIVIAIAIIYSGNMIKNKVSKAKDSSMSFVQDLMDGPFRLEAINWMPDTVEKISISNITADTTLVSSKGIEYSASNMIDGDVTTCWQEGADDSGVGNKITITFDEPTAVNYLVIHNGNQKTEESFWDNNRLYRVFIYADSHKTKASLDYGDRESYFKLKGKKQIKQLEIEIRSVDAGNRFDDTCVAEIECYKDAE